MKKRVPSKDRQVLPATINLVQLAPPGEGLVAWLLSCPAKGYFVPIESESTDTLAKE